MTVPRSWVRNEQEEQGQGLESADQPVEEEAGADEELGAIETAAPPLVANDAGHGVEPIIYRRPHQLFVATAPTITDIQPIALEADETDQLAMTGKLGQNMQELVQKVFPFEDEDPVPIASQHVVRYLLAKVEHLQASHWEVLYETPLPEIAQIRAKAEAEDEDLEEVLEEASTVTEAQEKAQPEQGERAGKRS